MLKPLTYKNKKKTNKLININNYNTINSKHKQRLIFTFILPLSHYISHLFACRRVKKPQILFLAHTHFVCGFVLLLKINTIQRTHPRAHIFTFIRTYKLCVFSCAEAPNQKSIQRIFNGRALSGSKHEIHLVGTLNNNFRFQVTVTKIKFRHFYKHVVVQLDI